VTIREEAPLYQFVMPGLLPANHVFLPGQSGEQDVDGRDKPGHDVDGLGANYAVFSRLAMEMSSSTSGQ
jgi:hypothetical protein